MKKIGIIFLLICILSNHVLAFSFESKFIKVKRPDEELSGFREVYSFQIDNYTVKAYKNEDGTNMTWEEWLSVDAPGFNIWGFDVVGGTSVTPEKYYTISFINDLDEDGKWNFLYAQSNQDRVYEMLVKEGETVNLPDISEAGYTNEWYQQALIDFTIDGVPYQSPEGITWEEWLKSAYNNYHYYSNGQNLTIQDPRS